MVMPRKMFWGSFLTSAESHFALTSHTFLEHLAPGHIEIDRILVPGGHTLHIHGSYQKSNSPQQLVYRVVCRRWMCLWILYILINTVSSGLCAYRASNSYPHEWRTRVTVTPRWANQMCSRESGKVCGTWSRKSAWDRAGPRVRDIGSNDSWLLAMPSHICMCIHT